MVALYRCADITLGVLARDAGQDYRLRGDWLATLRVGKELPFAEWELILRNVSTGEALTVATGDPSLVEVPGLESTLYSGLAPDPALGNGVLVWEEFYRTESGAGRKMFAMDLATGTRRTLIDIPDATVEDIRAPAVGGDTIAWLHPRFAPGAPVTHVLDVVTGDGPVVSYDLPGQPYLIGLSPDGSKLFWESGRSQQNVTDLATGVTTTIAEDMGFGVYVSGDYVSWVPTMTSDEIRVGYYSIANGITYAATVRDEDSRTSFGWVLGPWFAWNVAVRDGDTPNDPERSFLHVMRLP